MNDDDVSIIRNKPDPTFDPTKVVSILGKQPQPDGEVPAGSAAPDFEAASVEQNTPDDTPAAPEQQSQPEGEVPAGSNSLEQPPSVIGTSQEPEEP